MTIKVELLITVDFAVTAKTEWYVNNMTGLKPHSKCASCSSDSVWTVNLVAGCAGTRQCRGWPPGGRDGWGRGEWRGCGVGVGKGALLVGHGTWWWIADTGLQGQSTVKLSNQSQSHTLGMLIRHVHNVCAWVTVTVRVIGDISNYVWPWWVRGKRKFLPPPSTHKGTL